MSSPMVSVKMITYNHRPYIEQAIEGVVKQETNFPIELVIGEDCSTDGTREIVFEYEKRYPDIIRVVTSDKNIGAKMNSNRTNALCRGKYIAYCEGDDYWHRTDKLQIQVDYMESHPDCGLVASDYDLFTVKDSRRIQRFRRSTGKPVMSDPTIEDILTAKSGIQTLTVLARRDLVEDIKAKDPFIYTTGHFLMGDTQLYAEMSLRARIHSFDESLATHLVLEESATQSRDKKKVMRFRKNGAELCLYLIDKHGLPEQLREMHEKTWTRHAIRLAFAEQDSQMAEEVRTKFHNLSWKDYGWYWGAKYPAIQWGVLSLSNILKYFRT